MFLHWEASCDTNFVSKKQTNTGDNDDSGDSGHSGSADNGDSGTVGDSGVQGLLSGINSDRVVVVDV
jgi:hypothetical protein